MSTTRKPRSTAAGRNSAASTTAAKKTSVSRSRAKKPSAAAPADVGRIQASATAKQSSPPASESRAALQGTPAPMAAAVNPEAIHRMIAEAAYYRAERRGFAPGREELDWFEAEAEVRASARRS